MLHSFGKANVLIIKINHVVFFCSRIFVEMVIYVYNLSGDVCNVVVYSIFLKKIIKAKKKKKKQFLNLFM
jgi:hypothetical protein